MDIESFGLTAKVILDFVNHLSNYQIYDHGINELWRVHNHIYDLLEVAMETNDNPSYQAMVNLLDKYELVL